MSRKFQLSRIKTANLPYIAAEVESIIAEAPGAPKPVPPVNPRSASKQELADAEITRSAWCGTWTTDTHCTTCKAGGYPTIDDLGATA